MSSKLLESQSIKLENKKTNDGERLKYEMILLLKKFLLTLKQGEQHVEIARQILASFPEFEPHSAFQRLDQDQDGAVSSVDILKFLRQNKVDEANEADCYNIIKYFAAESKGVMYYHDFLQIVMPVDNSNLRAQIAMRPNFVVPPGQPLGPRIETSMAQLFEKEIALNRVLEEQRQSIDCSKQFNYSKAFKEIDDWNYGYIDKKNLKSFLRKHGYLANNHDVMSIIRRMDLDGDARLTEEEFITCLLPSEPYSKSLKRKKDLGKVAYSTKCSAQGPSYQHFQDAVLNLVNGGRDHVRNRANDRLLSGSGKKAHNSNSYGTMGANSLKIRPDMNRQNTGFFNKASIDGQERKANRLNVPKNVLLLHQKFNDKQKVHYMSKLAQGQALEDFKNKNVWRPGGDAVKKRTQQEFDLQLIQSSKQMNRSISQEKLKKKKMIKRLKSACNYLSTQNLKSDDGKSRKTKKKKSAKQKQEHQQKDSFSYEPTNYTSAGGFNSYPINLDISNQKSSSSGKIYRNLKCANINDRSTGSLRKRSGSKQSQRRSGSRLSNRSSCSLRNTQSNQRFFEKSMNNQQEYDNLNVPYFGNNPLKPPPQDQNQNYNSVRFVDQSESQAGFHPLRERSAEQIQDHIERSSHIIRTRLDPREQVITESPTPKNIDDGERIYFDQNEDQYGGYEGNDEVQRTDQSFDLREYEARMGAKQYIDEQRNLLQRKKSHLSSNNSDQGIEEFNAQYALENSKYIEPQRNLRKNFPVLDALETSTLVGYLLDLLNLSRSLESIKMELAMKQDFNLMDAFGIFDDTGEGHCTLDKFKEKLTFIGAAVPERCYLEVFFKRYNKQNDGHLKYSEFMNAILPISEEFSKMMMAAKPHGVFMKPKHPISMWEGETYGIFVRVIDNLLKAEMAVQDVIQKLSMRPNFSPERAFHTLALEQVRFEGTESVDFITYRDLNLLMEKHNHNNILEQLDLRLLIERFDKDNDGKIGKNEFFERFHYKIRRGNL